MTMTGRLRLLLRFSYLEISPPGTILPFTTRRDVSTLSSCTRRVQRVRTIKNIVSHQLRRRREEYAFCTRAMTEGAQLFWPYLSVRIRCSKDVADTLSEALLCFGAGSTSIDMINYEDPCETWITSLFADGQDVHTCISLAADSICLKYVPEYEVSMGEQYDLLKNIEETFHPIEVKNGLWIVPKSRTPPVQNATNIILNPGMAFGTGDHPTTKLCLCLLHGLIKGGEKFLDYGTGSGVLGIAALKMGAELSVGIDVDPQAVESALQNIALNVLEADRMRVYLVSSGAREFSSAANCNFDIVIANLLLNPLLELAEDIVYYGKPGALIALSGILSDQVNKIKEKFSVYIDDISVTEMDGWACVHGIIKGTK